MGDTYRNAPTGVIDSSVTNPATAASLAGVIGPLFGQVVLAPLGTGADDLARIVAVLAVCKANHWTLVLGYGVSGVWYFLSQQQWLSGTSVVFEPNCTIKYDCRPVGSGAETASCIYFDKGVSATTTTVAALVVVGSNLVTVVSNAALSVGDRIQLDDAAKNCEGYEIKAKPGGNVLQLDADVSYPFPPGALVCKVPAEDQCRDIKIDFGGAHASNNVPGTPTLDKFIELFSAWDCEISNLFLDASGVVLMGGSFDLGGVRNTWKNVWVDAGGVATICLAFEGGRDSKIENCHMTGATVCNLFLPAGHNIAVEDCTFDVGYDSISFCATVAGNTNGCSNCVVRGGRLANASHSGVHTGYGSHDILIDNVEIVNCANGVWVGDASARITIRKCVISVGTGDGVKSVEGASDTVIESSLITGFVGHGVWITSGPVYIRDTTIKRCFTTEISVQTATLYVRDVLLRDEGQMAGAFGYTLLDLPAASGAVLGSGLRLESSIARPTGRLAAIFPNSTGGYLRLSKVTQNHPLGSPVCGILNFSATPCEFDGWEQYGGQAFVNYATSAKLQVNGNLRLTGINTNSVLELDGGTQLCANFAEFTSDGSGNATLALPQVTANSLIRVYSHATGLPMQATWVITPSVGVVFSGLGATARCYCQIL